MAVSGQEGFRFYNLSYGKTLPEWLSEKKKDSLRYNQDYRKRIELLQDAHFPIASQRIKMSADGRYLVATGTYPPQVKVFEVSQLSMKFERHLDCEVVQFQVLSEDYSKLVFLHTDRSVEFHAKYGTYFKTRIPKFGRDMVYYYPGCDLYVAGSGNEIYRLNLDQGRFLAPLQTNSPGFNVAGMSPVHSLLAFGAESGVVDFFDPRSKKAVGQLNMLKALSKLPDWDGSGGAQVTALQFDKGNGLTLGLGSSTGQCLLYDLRNNEPFAVKDHRYAFPIKDIIFHSHYVLSADTKILKIWEPESGKVVGNVEPAADINNVMLVPDSGLAFIAGEQKKIQMYYIPSLDPAPSWCSFLDNITEELEEDGTTVIYDDYKFITREELQRLGASKMLAGSAYLRPYMHGFFMDMRLYHKLRSVADPFAYDRYRAERVKAIRAERAATRISVQQKKTPKVNAELATTGDAATDGRFDEMFKDPDFKVSESSADYKRIRSARPSGFTKVLERVQATNDKEEEESMSGPSLYEYQGTEQRPLAQTPSHRKKTAREEKLALGTRLKAIPQEVSQQPRRRTGGMEMTFTVEKKTRKREREPTEKKNANKQESEKRKRRSVAGLFKKNA